jgi:hypothetical protein
VTGGEKMEKFCIFVIMGLFYLSLSQKSKIFDSSLIRGSQGALRALSPYWGDTFTNEYNNLYNQPQEGNL